MHSYALVKYRHRVFFEQLPVQCVKYEMENGSRCTVWTDLGTSLC